MKRTFFGLAASFMMAGTLVAAQGAQQPSSRPAGSQDQRESASKSADVTLTGCLVQGSSPNTFILQNAKTSTDPATSKGQSYVLQASAGSAVDFKSHLNNQVRVVGAQGAASGSGAGSSSPGMGAGSSSGMGAGSSSSGSSSSSPSAGSGSSAGSSAGQPSSSAGAGQSGSSAGQSGSSSSSPSAGQAGSSSSSQPAMQGSSTSERTMARLSARTITKVADTCPAS